MPPVYRANPINYLPWANLTTPRIADYTIEGADAGVKMDAQLSKLAFDKAMYPLELQAASLKAQMLDAQLARVRNKNNAERMEISAKQQEYDENKKTELAAQSLEKQKFLDNYNARMGRFYNEGLLKGDFTDLVKEMEMWARNGNAMWMAESPYSLERMRTAMNAAQRQDFEQQLSEEREEQHNLDRSNAEKLHQSNVEAREKNRELEDEPTLQKYMGKTRIVDLAKKQPHISLGKGRFKFQIGRQKEPTKMLKQTVKNIIAKRIEELGVLPSDNDSYIKLLRDIDTIATGPEHFFDINFASGLAQETWLQLVDPPDRMRSPDSTARQKRGAQALLERQLQAIIDIGPEGERVRKDEEKAAREEERKREDLESDVFGTSAQGRASLLGRSLSEASERITYDQMISRVRRANPDATFDQVVATAKRLMAEQGAR